MRLGIAAGVVAGCALLSALAQRRSSAASLPGVETAAHLDATRAFNRSSALLALSVLADSGIEHYRGSKAVARDKIASPVARLLP